MTLVELNACDVGRFVDAIGGVFERSPWVAERAWKHRPFASVNQLHSVMAAEVAAAAPNEQLALLAAHPDLGTRAKMTESSTREQSSAGLDRLTPSEFARLVQLNATYH
jgi:2-oxo-4-hydroxy-4-carboxy-5-ureidoimidazoline decarboxylase